MSVAEQVNDLIVRLRQLRSEWVLVAGPAEGCVPGYPMTEIDEAIDELYNRITSLRARVLDSETWPEEE